MSNTFSMFFIRKLLDKIPFAIMQFFLDYSFKKMLAKYPRIFSKVSEKEDLSFLIVPTDLPFNFYLNINKEYPYISIIDKKENPNVNATIKSTLSNLLMMFEGNLDGDAAFFSKDLIIEGSTAAVVTLRNAIDGENINIINDLTEDFWVLKDLFRRLFFISLRKVNNMDLIVKEIQNEILKECNHKINQHSNDISYLKKEFYKFKSIILNNLGKE